MPQTVFEKFYDHRKEFGDDHEMETTITRIEDLDNAIASSEKPINLNLSHKRIVDIAVQVSGILVTKSLTSVSTIDLRNNDLTDIDAIRLACALRTARLPKKFTLNLSMNNFNKKGLEFLAQALASGNCPEGLHLKVDGRPSGNPLFLFAQALSSGVCPQGLTLVFNHVSKKYFKKDFSLIKEVIISGKCPNNLELDFDSQYNFDKTLFSDLADIIESHQYPDGFQIRFNDDNHFEDSLKGSERLFKVMNQNNFNKRALLGIGISNFFDKSLEVMKNQLQKYQPAPQFQLDLNTYHSWYHLPSVKMEIGVFLKNNELRHLALTYLTLSQGQRQETNILAKVTDDHVMHIMSFLLVIKANEKILQEASQSSEKKLLSLSNLRQYLFFDNKEQMIRAKVRENASLAKPGRCVIS